MTLLRTYSDVGKICPKTAQKWPKMAVFWYKLIRFWGILHICPTQQFYKNLFDPPPLSQPFLAPNEGGGGSSRGGLFMYPTEFARVAGEAGSGWTDVSLDGFPAIDMLTDLVYNK